MVLREPRGLSELACGLIGCHTVNQRHCQQAFCVLAMRWSGSNKKEGERERERELMGGSMAKKEGTRSAVEPDRKEKILEP